MSQSQSTQLELEAYLDEALTPAEMAKIEQALRNDPDLSKQLAAINSRRDAGVHTLGEIWRRHRVSCPTREQLGSFVLGALDEQHTAYITFHIKQVGCRLCSANLDDLERQQAERKDDVSSRRRKYYQSSAGYLGRKKSK